MKWIFVISTTLSAFVFCDAAVRVREQACITPQVANGRTRTRQRARLVKFLCLPGFEMVGNKYATCNDGEWDVPIPVCVRGGCKPLKELKNGIQLLSHRGAWSMFFCGPGYQLSGSHALFCNGKVWNGTMPACIDSSLPPSTSCDFESPDLCEWRNDEFHDFDWTRYSKKTPSAFMITGPSYDHTYGNGSKINGHYMYIESTGKQQYDMARLISPVYEAKYSINGGCFSFYYHMFGRTTGSLRVYFKPESINMTTAYTLFEKSGNQGDVWYREIFDLPQNNSEPFQIIIEGIRGKSYTSDIAIDDVALYETGEECVRERQNMKTVTPLVMSKDSCVNRCRNPSLFTSDMEIFECSCLDNCIRELSCCPDFYEVCDFEETTTQSSVPNEPAPQTMKLIGSSIAPLSPETTMTSTTLTTPLISTSAVPTTTTSTTTSKPITTKPTTRKTIHESTNESNSRTTIKVTKIVINATIKPITRVVPKIIFISTTPAPFNATGLLKNLTTISTSVTSTNTTVKPPVRTTLKATTPKATTTTVAPVNKRSTVNPNIMPISRTFENHNIYHDLVKNAAINQKKQEDSNSRQSVTAPVIGTIAGIFLVTLGLVTIVRTRWFRDNVDRIRARQHDHRAGEEVRYLTREDQLDFE